MTDDFYGGALFNADLAVAEQGLDQRYGLVPVSDEDAFFGPFRNSSKANPVLVIGTTHDPYTPYVWAKRLTHDLGNARLLTYRGDGHGAITDLNPCVVGNMLAYLEDGVLPPHDASCDQVL